MAKPKNNPTITQTAPTKMMATARQISASEAESGIATDYWLELLAYPPGSTRSLWFKVSNHWKRLDDPSPAIQDAVMSAFGQAKDNFEVHVWYDDSQVIVGLVIKSK